MKSQLPRQTRRLRRMVLEGVQLVGSEGLTENDPELADGLSSIQRLHYSAHCLSKDCLSNIARSGTDLSCLVAERGEW